MSKLDAVLMQLKQEREALSKAIAALARRRHKQRKYLKFDAARNVSTGRARIDAAQSTETHRTRSESTLGEISENTKGGLEMPCRHQLMRPPDLVTDADGVSYLLFEC